MKRGRARPHFTRLSFYGGYGYVVRIKAATALPLPKFISVLRHSPWMDYGVFLFCPLPLPAVPHLDLPVSKNLNEVHKMKEINLREYYPFYNMDVYLEVSDEIAGQLDRFRLDEEAHRVRVLRAKAYFSLDRGDGIEKDALQKPPQPLELILKAEQAARLDAALRSLSDCQRRRILAFYLDGESKAKIAERENVNESAVRKSIRAGLAALKKFLNAE